MDNLPRAVRQFERTFLPHLDSNESPDDRKTWEDMMRYPRPPQPPAEPKGELIAIAIYTRYYNENGELIDIKTRVERHI